MSFKRIILLSGESSKNPYFPANIELYDNSLPLNHIGNCANILCKSESVEYYLKEIQKKGYVGAFLVIDEIQYATGNGFITKDCIIGGK